MEKVFTSPVKNYIQRNGFIMVSNLLVDFQQELGINEAELMFIIKIMKNKSGYAIHDEDIDPTVCQKTIARRRNSLRDKGLLNFSVIKRQDPVTGRFKTDGVSYDLSPLEEKLQEISDELEKEKQAKVKEELKKERVIVESSEEEDTPLNKYKEDYKNTYGKEYKINDFELNKYNELSENNKQLIAYIFDYCKDNDLLGKLVPRLSLFFKVKFRFAELKKYCIDNDLIVSEKKEEAELEEEPEYKYYEPEDLTDLTREYYSRYYDLEKTLNYPFYRAIENIIGQNKKIGEPFVETARTNYLMDRAYETIGRKNEKNF